MRPDRVGLPAETPNHRLVGHLFVLGVSIIVHDVRILCVFMGRSRQSGELNGGCTYREQLGSEANAITVLDYLADRYRHSSRAEWSARIGAGRVVVDDRPVAEGDPLRSGQWLSWYRPPWREPHAPRSFAVLYDRGGVVAVAKPAGLPTLPGADFYESTLLRQLARYDSDLIPMHRLGRWTSGIVLCARDKKSRAELAEQFANRTIRKRYRALASGNPKEDQFVIRTPIGPVPHPTLGTVHGALITGKSAESRVRVLRRDGSQFLCDVNILSGRPHQIRIHLAAAGHPLCGDPLYAAGGCPRASEPALPGEGGYLLHGAEVGFDAVSDRGELSAPGFVRVHCVPPSPLIHLT